MENKFRYIKIKKTIYENNSFRILEGEDLINGEHLTLKGKFHSNYFGNIYKYYLEEVESNNFFKKVKTYQVKDYHYLESSDLLEEPIRKAFISNYFIAVPATSKEELLERVHLEKLPDFLLTNPKAYSLMKDKTSKAVKASYDKVRLNYLTDVSSYLLFKLGLSQKREGYFRDRFGEASYFEIMKDPYILTIFGGVPLNRTETFIVNRGLKEDPSRREDALIVDFSNQETFKEGHMYSSLSSLIDLRSSNFLTRDEAEKDTLKRISSMYKKRLLNYDKKKGVYSSFYNFKIEEELFLFLKRKIENPLQYQAVQDKEEFISNFKSYTGFDLSEDQYKVVEEISKQSVILLTGNAGSGKTTSVKALVDYLGSRSKSVALLSTTGRAAKVLSNKVGKKVNTIHSYLGFDGVNFRKGPHDKVKEKVIIVDEASMCDSFLANALVTALNKDTKLVLVGDVNQLPPVGPGGLLNVLYKIKEVPKIDLKTVFRQEEGSDILKASNSILEDPVLSEIPNSSSFKLVCKDDNHSKVSMVLNFVKNCVQNGKSYVLLSPIYKGELGVENLNNQIQKQINPNYGKGNYFSNGRYAFFEGDRVMFTRNDYSRKDIAICNGDLGTIVSITERFVKVDIGGEVVSLAKSYSSATMDLGYCVTVHKSQGSEYECACFCIDSSNSFFISKNLVYTAYTRAKNKLIVLTTNAFKSMSKEVLSNSVTLDRSSWLFDFLSDTSFSTVKKKKVSTADFFF